ncbi:MAG TPA: TniB family NTP-binding protein [Pseudomonadales bacterium]|nr:TniB family NTP-binding protein [Pseudomonadales bacterium]
METTKHLHENALRRLNDSPGERIDFILSDWWIGYDEANIILTEMDRLITHPRNLRMPCLAMISEANNGKTTTLRRCLKLHGTEYTDDDQIVLPVLFFEAPPEPDEGRLYSSILSALAVAHRQDAAPEKLLAKVIERLTMLNVKLLMGDEFHNILQGTPRNHRQFLTALKSLLNQLKLPFVAAGTPEVITALSVDAQFVTRFEYLELPRWDINQTTLRMIKSIERQLPLSQPSGLAEKDKAIPIISSSGNTLGGIVNIVKRSAVAAIQNGQNFIDQATLETTINTLNKRNITNR